MDRLLMDVQSTHYLKGIDHFLFRYLDILHVHPSKFVIAIVLTKGNDPVKSEIYPTYCS